MIASVSLHALSRRSPLKLALLTLSLCALSACGAGDVEPEDLKPVEFVEPDRDSGADDAVDAGSEPDATTPDVGEPDLGEPDMGEPDMKGLDMGEPDLSVEERAPGWMIARSQRDSRPLIAELYGDQGPTLFLLSAIHGNERIAVSFGERVRTLLLAGMAERLGVRIFFMQVGNPDGVEDHTRRNARNIDLNRNFPADNFGNAPMGGGEPLSETESMAIFEAITWSMPAAVVSVHCCGGLLDHDGPAEDLVEMMHQAAIGHSYFDLYRLGSRSGSLGSYVGLTLNTPIITVEMDDGTKLEPINQFYAIEEATEAAAIWVGAQQGAVEADILGQLIEEQSPNPYRQLHAGEAASGAALRVDLWGDVSGEHDLILGGFEGASRLSDHIAEHLRRQLLAEPNARASSAFKILTLANPDGLQTLSSKNILDVDVFADAFSDAPKSVEGRAVRRLLNDANLRRVYFIEEAERDGFEAAGPERAALLGAMRNSPSGLAQASEVETRYLQAFLALEKKGVSAVFFGVARQRYEDQHNVTDEPSVYWELLRSTW